MKKYLIIAMLLATPAFAQAPAPAQPAPEIAIYKQLLSEANDRVVAMGAQVQTQDAKIKELTKENADLKAHATAAKDPPKK